MVGSITGVGRSLTSFSAETKCGALLKELELVWTEIGETDAEKDHMLLELEMECLQIYRRKVDEAKNQKARLHQTVAAKEAELASLRASLGEHSLYLKTAKGATSLKEQLTLVTPLLNELREKKEERMKQISEIRSQINKINGEISGRNHSSDLSLHSNGDDKHDLSLRRLNEHQAELRTLQKEKSDRLNKVLEYVNEVHCLCGVLGIDFSKTVDEVHPSLHKSDSGKSTNISDSTLEGLADAVTKLKTEKKDRVQKLRETVASLYDLWKLMDSSEGERRRFGRVMFIVETPEDNITDRGALTIDVLEQTTAEFERLTKLKASRMKELVLKKRAELEDMCKRAHIEPDTSTAPEKSNALIDSGIVDPSELLASIEAEIMKARELVLSRKDIMDRVGKWLAACEEENWLEDYSQDQNRYSAGRGAHLSLKRAERARITITKIPGMVENLMNKAFAWEDEKNIPFMYDGVRLISILEEYKIVRQQKEDEKRRYRDQKRLQDLLLVEKELMYGSKPSFRCNSLNRRSNVYDGTMTPVPRRVSGTMTPVPRRLSGTMATTPRRPSAGSVTPELLTPRSSSGRQNGFFRETRKLPTAPLNFVPLSKEETTSSFASVSGSEPESPPQVPEASAEAKIWPVADL